MDYLVPTRRKDFPCSERLLRNLPNLGCNGWTTDYVLAETLGELKNALEWKLGKQHIKASVLSMHQIKHLEKIVNQVTHFPSLSILKSPIITQKEIYSIVRDLCVQAKDALVLLSTQKLGTKFANIKLVTRDGKLLSRGKKIVKTAHPSDMLGKCPTTCSKTRCPHRR